MGVAQVSPNHEAVHVHAPATWQVHPGTVLCVVSCICVTGKWKDERSNGACVGAGDGRNGNEGNRCAPTLVSA